MADRRRVQQRLVLAIGIVLTTGIVAASGVGCSSTRYVLEQAKGQLGVLTGRERIVDVLRRGKLGTRELSAARRRRLQLVLLARRYAHEQIGLRLTGAYTYVYDTGGRPIAFNLSAAPKDALRPRVWSFPIVGRVPYLGFFERSKARQARDALERQDLDTLLRPVAAYSSLGWFSDPVYTAVLDGDPWRLVELVIHETTHTTLFLRNEVSFNESLAVFVGQQGTLDLMARLLGPRAAAVGRVRAEMGRRRRFAVLVGEVYRRLERLYAQQLSRAEKLRRRRRVFDWARARYKAIFPDPRHWGAFVTRPLNNAVLLSYGRYNQGLRFHRRVYGALGRDLGRMVALYAHAQQFDDPVGHVARRLRIAGPGKQRM